jgi:hypothetical protein
VARQAQKLPRAQRVTCTLVARGSWPGFARDEPGEEIPTQTGSRKATRQLIRQGGIRCDYPMAPGLPYGSWVTMTDEQVTQITCVRCIPLSRSLRPVVWCRHHADPKRGTRALSRTPFASCTLAAIAVAVMIFGPIPVLLLPGANNAKSIKLLSGPCRMSQLSQRHGKHRGDLHVGGRGHALAKNVGRSSFRGR